MRLSPPEDLSNPLGIEVLTKVWLTKPVDKEVCMSPSLQWLITLFNMPENKARGLLGL